MLSNGTKFCIGDVLYSSKAKRNLLSFKDIRGNGYHIETNNEGSKEYLCITSLVSSQKLILEKLPIFSSSLYYTTMRTIKATKSSLIQRYLCFDMIVLDIRYLL